MKHIHFEKCESTQKYLIEKTMKEDIVNCLVSCDFQSHGVGQRKNTWDCYQNTLCFSFIAQENEVLNLTSLEMGVLICDFFKENANIQLALKWPNDILNHQGKKVGGIVINKFGNKKPIIGIGLNLSFNSSEKIQNYNIPAGFIFDTTKEFDKEKMASSIYHYIKEHRLTSFQTKQKWKHYCYHLKKMVTLNDSQDHFGRFLSIGEYGQAIIEIEGTIIEFYSGTLRIHN